MAAAAVEQPIHESKQAYSVGYTQLHHTPASTPQVFELPPRSCNGALNPANTYSPRTHHKIAAMTRPKIRPRGESDLGRPATKLVTADISAPNGDAYLSNDDEEEEPSSRWRGSSLVLPESLTGLILPIPFLFASYAHTSSVPISKTLTNFYLRRPAQITLEGAPYPSMFETFVAACFFASISLLCAGLLGKSLLEESQPLDRRKAIIAAMRASKKKTRAYINLGEASQAAQRAVGTLLPIYAALQLGGIQAGILWLLTAAAGAVDPSSKGAFASALHTWLAFKQNPYSGISIILSAMCAFATGLRQGSTLATLSAYGAFLMSITIFPPALPVSNWSTRGRYSISRTPISARGYETPSRSLSSDHREGCPTLKSQEDAGTFLLSGGSLAVATLLIAILGRVQLYQGGPALILSVLSAISFAGLALGCRPLKTRRNIVLGVAMGCSLIALFGDVPYASTSTSALVAGALSFLCLGAVAADASNLPHFVRPDLSGKSASHSHSMPGDASFGTRYILSSLAPGSVLYTIILERDSRRIAYFAFLNLAFMLVQTFYGFVTGSLGLLTDSIHMLFDCAGLAVGLAAAVMSKWPPSFMFPYGYHKIDALSGFANGIFLLLVSIEIVFDAVHRLREGNELHRLNELLVVSTLGFLVNIVGLAAFGHAHHGHGHDHCHGHGHSHTDQPHFDQDMMRVPDSAVSPKTIFASGHGSNSTSVVSSSHDHHHHSHQHSHDNENMRGIFLHILADALGSVSVIISTLLTRYTGWQGWDPIASCVISFLIFASAIPLVQQSGKRLVLGLPHDMEYTVRSVLGEVQELRGVTGIGVVRFWQNDSAVGSHEDSDHQHQHVSEKEAYLNGNGKHEHQHVLPPSILGTMHIIAASNANMEDLRSRASDFLKCKGMDVIVHIERENDVRCWCRSSSGARIR